MNTTINQTHNKEPDHSPMTASGDPLTVTKAVLSDLEEINNIRNYYIVHSAYNLNSETKTVEEMKPWFDDHQGKYPLLAAKIGDMVVGWASIWQFRTFSGYSQTVELSVYIDPDYRRMGVGNRLITELERLAKENGFHCMVAVVAEPNEASFALHQKLGFSVVGTIREAGFKNGSYVNMILLSKLL